MLSLTLDRKREVITAACTIASLGVAWRLISALRRDCSPEIKYLASALCVETLTSSELAVGNEMLVCQTGLVGKK